MIRRFRHAIQLILILIISILQSFEVAHAMTTEKLIVTITPPLPVSGNGQSVKAENSKPQTIEFKKTKKQNSHFVFDFPITYNSRVKFWIKYFQTSGRKWFQTWLERSPKYLPALREMLKEQNLPQDLAYVAMIESGFSNGAKSTASAVGLWQFISATGNRYGLRTQYWLDERRDFEKSTRAAIKYKKDLYRLFGSWYLVAASYNTGENRIKRLLKQHHTRDFWKLADLGVLHPETMNYVPKIIAATLIAKAPALYGFRDLNYETPYEFEQASVPGGTKLDDLAQHLGVRPSYLKELNPELILGYIPRDVRSHQIRVPLGSRKYVLNFTRRYSTVGSLD